MKPIYIFCLHNCRTGGPEAVHQLSDALLEQGFDARLIYYQEADIHQVGVNEAGAVEERWGVPREFPPHANNVEEYARYRTNPARSLDLSKPCVIVLPETLAHMAALFPRHDVLIWWLSLDNGLEPMSRINLNLLRTPNVRHAYQSRYAERVCDALGFVSAGMLSDYTTDLTEYAKPLAWAERPKLVTFAAGRKVVADLDAIIAELHRLDPEIECVKIQGMSRAQVASAFAYARVHVDLGNFPGKDRGPREAISMCCRALVAHAGAAPETGAFICGGTAPEQVAESVMALLTGEPEFVSAHERLIFFTEVRDVFSGLASC